MIENEPEMGDTLLDNKTNCFKKHLLTIIFLLLGIVIIVSIVIVIVLLRGKKNGDKNDNSFKYGLNITELRRRTSPEYLGTISLLKENATEYESLDENDKKALFHLVKATEYLENIEYQIDDHYNLPFKKFLEEEIAKK